MRGDPGVEQFFLFPHPISALKDVLKNHPETVWVYAASHGMRLVAAGGWVQSWLVVTSQSMILKWPRIFIRM